MALAAFCLSKFSYFFLIALFVNAVCCTSSNSTQSPILNVTFNVTVQLPGYGAIVGSSNGIISSFLGVPFAAKPIGSLRFAAPQPVSPWTSPIVTQSYPTRCTQLDYEFAGPVVGGEDCLYLNIWAPTAPPQANKSYPVLFYIMGGGFSFYAYQTGEKIAANSPNTIVVIAHYRLGIFGFMVSPELVDGNVGLQDQVAALTFLKTTLPAFNGDPTRITVVGESAGSIAACLHLVSPLSRGLFSQAVMQSGGCDLPQPLPSSQYGVLSAFASSSALVAQAGVNCSTAASVIACLRSVPALSLQIALAYFNYKAFSVVVVDGVFVTQQPSLSFQQGRQLNIPMIIGSVKNEYGYYAAYSGASAFNSFTFSSFASTIPNLPSVQSYYSPSNPVFLDNPFVSNNSAINAYIDYNSATIFQCPNLRTARYMTNSNNRVYLYSWEYNTGRGFFAPWGVVHSSELPFLFQNPQANEDAKMLTGGFLYNYTAGGYLTADEVRLSLVLQQYWLRFVHNGDPNIDTDVSLDGALPSISWPLYQVPTSYNMTSSYTSLPVPASAESYLQFKGASSTVQLTTANGYHEPSCQIQDAILQAQSASTSPTSTPSTPTPTTPTSPTSPTSFPPPSPLCPSAFPYLCTSNWDSSVCFNEVQFAQSCAGPSTSWCALSGAPSQIQQFLANGAGIHCFQAVAANCPRSFPYLCENAFSNSLCFNDVKNAIACEGPANSWCAQPYAPSTLLGFIQQGYGISCTAPEVTACPSSFPFLCTGSFGSSVCFANSAAANACNGPIGSWCALNGAPATITDFVSQGYGQNCH